MVVPLIPQSDIYGKWETTPGRCIPKVLYQNPDLLSQNADIKCEDRGIRKIKRKCIPNPNTGWGCKWGGRQSFDTIVEEEECDVQCARYKWKKIYESNCYNYKKYVTYQCKENDPEGSNLCGKLNPDTKTITRYNLGHKITTTEICDDPVVIPRTIKEVFGEWITVNPEVPDDVAGIYSNFENYQNHLGTDLCPTEYPLDIGTVPGKLACLNNGTTYTGSLARKMCSESPPEKPKMINCYKLDKTMPYGVIFDDDERFLSLKYPKREDRNIYYPDISHQNVPTEERNYQVLDLFFDIYYPITGHSKEQVISSISAKFYFAIHKGFCYIFIVAPYGHLGWLHDGKWHRAKLGPGSDSLGLLRHEITRYRCTISENDRVTIRTLDGNFLYISNIPFHNLKLQRLNYKYDDFLEQL